LTCKGWKGTVTTTVPNVGNTKVYFLDAIIVYITPNEIIGWNRIGQDYENH